VGVSAVYDHENREGVRVEERRDARGRLRYAYVSPRTITGSDLDEDRWDIRGRLRYAFASSWTFTAEGGAGLIDPEGYDAETTFVGSASLEKGLEHDRFLLRGEKSYTSEFTTSHYGTYDTTSAEFSWERRLHAAWTSTARLSFDRRRPTGATIDQEERDASAGISLVWNPVEQFHVNWRPIETLTVSLNWRYLRTSYETSGVARENRYGTVVEVRF
ncbi:MAG TPA: hypothetical protein PLW83_09025, partial [Deltaproteobacteria bacterium]|nr:hypothetical protein [Deltaproteobacteria bacterium]